MRGLESRGRAAALFAVVVSIAGCGGTAAGGNPQHTTATRASMQRASVTTSRSSLEGPTFNHPQAAPSFALPNYREGLVRLAAYKGKAVLLTFVFTHCRDVCPTIVAGLHNALQLLGSRASRVQVIAVSVDPTGDTPGAIAAFLARHRMTGRMKYLIGSRSRLTAVWRQWGVNASNPTADDNLSHTSVVFGIAANGKVMTAYPANFSPAEIAHDVPILARL